MSNDILEIIGKGQNCSGVNTSNGNSHDNENGGESSGAANQCSSAYLIGIKDEKTNTIKLF